MPSSTKTKILIVCVMRIVLLSGCVSLTALLGWPSGGSRELSPAEYREMRVSVIAKAIAAYEESHGQLPCCVQSDTGIAKSWRVAICPHLGRGNLLTDYKLDEQWDSLANRRFGFECLAGAFDYDGSGYPVNGDRAFSDFAMITYAKEASDLVSYPKRVLVIEAVGTNIEVTECEHFTPGQIVDLIVAGGVKPTDGKRFAVVRCNYGVDYIHADLPAPDLRNAIYGDRR